MFPLVSIASIPVAYTVTTQPLSDFILPPSRRLLKDIFTATLWNQNQHTYKKPVLFNFLSLEFFLIFYHLFFFGKEPPCCSCCRSISHLAGEKKKQSFLLYVLSFLVKMELCRTESKSCHSLGSS